MIGWLIFAGYALGWLATARFMAVNMIDGSARKELENRQDWPSGPEKHYNAGKPLVDMEERILSLALAAFTGIAWPLVIVVYAVARSLKTPTERREDQRVELEALRKQAREYGLPLGDEK